MRELDIYNTKDMKCVLATGRCPGECVSSSKKWGCPHWCTITVNENEQIKTYTGCGVLMIPEIQLTISKNSNRVAASVQSYRNEIVESINNGMKGLADAVISTQGQIVGTENK
jgi:hypothetical protein